MSTGGEASDYRDDDLDGEVMIALCSYYGSAWLATRPEFSCAAWAETPPLDGTCVAEKVTQLVFGHDVTVDCAFGDGHDGPHRSNPVTSPWSGFKGLRQVVEWDDEGVESVISREIVR